MSDVEEDDCGEWNEMLHAFLDGELDSLHAARFENHLATCANCRQELERLKAMRRLLGRDDVKWQAPPALRADILAAIAEEHEASRSGAAIGSTGDGRWRRWLQFARQWSFIPSLAALAASLIIVMSVPNQDMALRDQILAGHVRSMLADHLTDVQTSDQHTVKPWFNGRLDFSPPVVDLTPQGFPLVGGRVDYLDGRVVAALVYRRHGHVINLFVWPGPPATVEVGAHDGYNFARWSKGGLVFWAISDVAAPDLVTFRDDFVREAGQ